MAQTTRGTAKARGVGSYSKVRTSGPGISAPSEQMAATSSAGAKASPRASAIRRRPQMPSARVAICWAASTSPKPAPVAARRARAVSFRRSLFQLLFGPDAVGVEFQRFGECLARLGVAILLAQAEAKPEVSFGIAGIEFDGLLEIRDGELGAAAKLSGDIVIADAASHVHHGRFGRLLHGLVDGVLGLKTVGESAHDVGDGLAVERSEEAIVLGAGGFQGDGFFGEPDALLGNLAAAFAIAQFDHYLGEIAIGQGGAVLGLGIVGRFAGGGPGLGGEFG